MKDLRYALRTLRRSPGFAAVAILTLALGIGANTAIFSFVNGILLNPLPYKNADRIVRVLEKPPGGGRNGISTSRRWAGLFYRTKISPASNMWSFWRTSCG